MQIDVQLFSILRECLPPGAERGQATIELPDGATVGDLLAHLGIGERLGCAPAEVVTRASWQVLVSGRHETDMTRTLQDGDAVQVFPPVSGGGMSG